MRDRPVFQQWEDLDVDWPLAPTDTGFVPFMHAPSIFTPEECEHILALAGEFQSAREQRYFDASFMGASFNEDADVDFVYEALESVVRTYNQACHYSLVGFVQTPRISRYTVGEGVPWHTDHNVREISKISMSVLLNDPASFEGGQLEILEYTVPRLEQGDAVVFTSHLAHRVTELSAGERLVLVAWVAGSRFV